MVYLGLWFSLSAFQLTDTLLLLGHYLRQFLYGFRETRDDLYTINVFGSFGVIAVRIENDKNRKFFIGVWIKGRYNRSRKDRYEVRIAFFKTCLPNRPAAKRPRTCSEGRRRRAMAFVLKVRIVTFARNCGFMIDFKRLPSPCYVLDERSLLNNLHIIDRVRRESGAEIIVALKACAMWSVFPMLAAHSDGATASSAAEARLVWEEFGVRAHTYAPAYTDRDFDKILQYSDYITFNSLNQFTRFGARAIMSGISCGLRINPGWSPVTTELYNPCSPASRLGIPASELRELPPGIEGLHFHNLCESEAADLKTTLEIVERDFGHLLGKIKWVNMGGGHLMTRQGYDTDLLVETLVSFRGRHPGLRVIMEPGSAFTWRTGYLVSSVEDIVRNGNSVTAMLDVSFACHMPDCLEMPYKPGVLNARDPAPGERGWRLGGNSCLAGDWCGEWVFEREPRMGDRIVFEDMIHYTMVKTTMFNGVRHPSIAIARTDGSVDIIREFGYEDYRDRMS